jgi:hypothetical protein
MLKARLVVVWLSTLLFTLFLGSTASAQLSCPGGYEDMFPGSPTMQTGRLAFSGVATSCASSTPTPALADSTARKYYSRAFTNNTGSTACYAVGGGTHDGWSWRDGFIAVYTTFNPADPTQNYIADTGVAGNYRTVSFSVPNGTSFDVVTTDLTGTSTYSYIGITGCSPQVSASLGSTPNPSVFGESVVLQATVTTGGATATGTINFMEGSTSLGTSTLTAGTTSISIASLAPGAHSITAVYSGDGTFPGATSSAHSHTVNAAASTTTVSSSQSPQTTGAPVTFTATVAATPPGSGTPTGTVTFTEGSTSLGTVTLAGGQASLTTSSLAVGSHTITATYNATAEFTSSSGTTTQLIDPGAAIVAVDGTPNTTTYGQVATFTATVTAMTGSTPTGTITFKNGTNVLVTVPLDGAGTASFTIATLDVGTHTIVADYNGDVNHNASTGSTPHAVNQAPTTSALVSIVNPSRYGQTASFTGTVSGTVGTPTGLVSLFDGTAMIGSAALDPGGIATFSTELLAVGTHPLTLVYAGDTIYLGSTSAVTNHVVNKSATIVALASSQNPQGVGATITFTATISAGPPGVGNATGDVSFFDNTGTRVRLGGSTIANGQATLDVSSLAVGLHAITADYAGDANFNSASSGSVFQQIDPLVSSIALTTAPDPSTFGQAVVVTAVVAPGTGGTATGTITFTEGGNSLGMVALDGSGSANLSLNSLTVGTHTINAAYSGDNNHNPATASVAHVVNAAATTTVMVSSANPSVFGQNVRLTATVASTAGTPSGTVVFREGTITHATVTLDNGVAFIDLNELSVGNHSITAAYSGATNFATSATAEPVQVVNKATTSVAVTSSSNPVIVGTNVTFTATVSVTTPGAGTPAGNVEFRDGTTVLGTTALSGGTASYTTSALTVGDHPITAVYAGDDSFVTSTSAAITQTVSTAGATLAISVSPNPTVYGQNATVTAIAAATTGGVPTGTVTFTEGTTTLGTGTLATGSATFVIGTLGVGTHSITATYGGDTNHPAGANATAQLTVGKRATRTTLASSVNPTTQGQATTLTATVAIADLGVDAGGGPSTGLVPLSGTVTFKNGQTTLGTATLTNGTATLSVTSLMAGSHSLTASFQGAANYDESASTAVVQVVNQPEAGVPDASPPDATTPDVRDAGPDMSVPDVRLPDAVSPPPDTTSPPDVVVDVRLPDAAAPDAVVSDVARDTTTDAIATDVRVDVRTDAQGDASTPPGGDDGGDDGCGCRLASRSTGLSGVYALGLAIGVASLRRRRRSKSASL